MQVVCIVVPSWRVCLASSGPGDSNMFDPGRRRSYAMPNKRSTTVANVRSVTENVVNSCH